MIEWLLKLIGASETFTADLQRVQFAWARPGLLWIGLVLLLPIGLFIVVRHSRNLPHINHVSRHVLSICRIGVLLLMVIALGGPLASVEESEVKKPILAIALDDSASMLLSVGPFDDITAARIGAAAGLHTPHRETNKTNAKTPDNSVPLSPQVRQQLNRMSRLELASAILTHQHSTVFAPLYDRFELRTYRVARSVRTMELAKAKQGGETGLSSSDRDGTALGTLVNHVIDDAADSELAGLLLLSDGRNTMGPPPLVVWKQRAGAAQAETTLMPVWAVPIGSRLPLKDVALLDAFAPAQVSVNDTVTILATITSNGFAHRDVKVMLKRGQKVLQEKILTLREAKRQQVELSYQTTSAGTDLLTVQVEPQPEEKIHQNNQETVQLDVDPNRYRVLYLEGAPRWDFRFLDHSLRRDNGLDVTFVMEAQIHEEDPGERAAAEAPVPQNANAFAAFDTIILGDVSPSLLPHGVQEQLVRSVQEKGTGLIVQAGILHMPSAFLTGPLAKILPTQFDVAITSAETTRAGIEAPAHRPFQMLVTALGAIHPALRLYDSAPRNRHIWSQMPRFYWASATVNPKAGTTVLAEIDTDQGKRPLITEHFVGRGRVLFVGTDSTYLWRQHIGSHLFYRFWGQAIRHVSHRPQHGGDQSWVEVYPVRAEPGEHVSVQLYTVDREGQPLDASSVELQLLWADSINALTLRQAEQPGHFHGTWQPTELGEYQLGYTDSKGRAVHAVVHVAGSGQEFRQPIVDHEAMAALAEQSGGGVIELYELDKLLDQLKGEPVEHRRVHEEELWDNWLTLTLLIGLYCTDVGVRRLLGLT